ncbi:Tyrosine recombinase XerD [Moorella thermoacetica]|uniref:Tyrosine recombinase XerD n=1 Tax=Neomoorella thermoacetica TaxID=1525 RepID=A0AAC9HGB7_NEOTH|nr:tyrosine-type recombinase/integrase [Moorella thermoacetica]AOQ23182.1 Tyrosine recombinase XerD [Moorella thermoacetica]TYL12889.1 Tyrosine recombinase XerD [Moorella thermoacetica]
MKARLSIVKKPLTLEEAVSQFLNYHQSAGTRETTVKWYKYALEMFAKWAAGRGITMAEKIDESLIEKYRDWYRCRNVKPTTVNTNLRALKCFLNFAGRRGITALGLGEKVKFLRAVEPAVPTFNLKQLEKLLDAPNRTTFVGLRDYTIMHVMMDTGVRIGELLGAKKEDLIWDAAAKLPEGFTVKKPKGPRERVVNFPPDTSVVVADWVNVLNTAMPDSAWLFPSSRGGRLAVRSFQDNMKRYGRIAGIEGVRVSPHTFRHTLAKHYLMEGGDLESLRDILGHSSIETTSRYGRLFNPDLKKKLARLCPSAALRKRRR